MVTIRLLFFIFLAIFSDLSADDAQISATISSDSAYENYPLQGIVTVTHNPKDTVDASSFKLDNQPLEVQFTKTVSIAPTLEVAFYTFTIPGKKKGVYLLPPISVKVGNNQFQSVGSGYEVSGAAKIPPSVVASQQQAKLELKGSVEGPQPLYPGQETKLIYRYYFSGDIELSEEKLPLLDATGFEKIGDKVINTTHQGGMDVQEISQTVKALNPGEYQFPASSAAGYAYIEDPVLKTRTYIQPQLQTEVPPITVTVSPFPEAGRPNTFTGAVGPFTFKVSLLTPTTVSQGEKMLIAIDVSSDSAQLNTVSLPNLNQPGIKGLFRLSDLPPVGTVHDNTIHFEEELFPLVPGIKEIPSITFSYFDPKTSQYVTLQSDPIPITVQARSEKALTPAPAPTPAPTVEPAPAPKAEEPPKPTEAATELPPNLQTPIPEPIVETPPPIEIASIVDLTEEDLHNLRFGTWWGLLLIPAGALLLFLQMQLRKRMLASKSVKRAETSADIWKRLVNLSQDSPEFQTLLERALMLNLVEKGLIPSVDISPEDIPETGEAGQVRDFLRSRDEKRFTGKAVETKQHVLEEARKLIK